METNLSMSVMWNLLVTCWFSIIKCAERAFNCLKFFLFICHVMIINSVFVICLSFGIVKNKLLYFFPIGSPISSHENKKDLIPFYQKIFMWRYILRNIVQCQIIFIRKNIIACLFSVHNTINLSRHEKVCLMRLRFERYLSKEESLET